MAETCVLGHAWTPGRVLCAVCGFGPRALQPNQTAPASRPATTAEPELAVAGASPRTGRGLQLEDAAAAPTLATEPTAPELVLSPDGQWAWDGTQWVPAPVQPEAAPQADLLPEPAPRRSRSRGRAAGAGKPARSLRFSRSGRSEPQAPVAADTATATATATLTAAAAAPAHQKAGRRSPDPKLLIVLVLVLAVAAAADYALKLAPLGHKTATVSAAPVVSGATILAAREHAQDAFARTVLQEGAAVEKTYRAKSGLYASTVAQLHTAGMATVRPPAVFAVQAHHGTGFCLAAGAQARGTRFFLYDSVRGGLRPTVYPTEAAALRGCSQHG